MSNRRSGGDRLLPGTIFGVWVRADWHRWTIRGVPPVTTANWLRDIVRSTLRLRQESENGLSQPVPEGRTDQVPRQRQLGQACREVGQGSWRQARVPVPRLLRR